MSPVLHVVSSLGMGGTEKLVCDLLCKSALWHRTEQYLMVVNDVVDEGLLTRLRTAGVSPILVARRPGSRSPGALLRAAAQLRKVAPKVVHCHNEHAVVWSVLMGAPLIGAKLVRTVHATRVVPAFSFVDSFLHNRMVTRVVAVSRSVMSECEAAGLRGTLCIYNGIDLAAYRRTRSNNCGARRILSVGRISIDMKGHDLLIDAVAICKSRGANFDVQFVGDEALGEPGARARLEQRAAEAGLGSSVQFLGNRHDVPALMREADFFVLPSRVEGFGLALVEAMAAGLPVVASAVDGPREIVRDGIDGLLFPSGDAEALAEKLLLLRQDESSRETLSCQAVKRAEMFSLERTIQEHERLYEELAK